MFVFMIAQSCNGCYKPYTKTISFRKGGFYEIVNVSVSVVLEKQTSKMENNHGSS